MPGAYRAPARNHLVKIALAVCISRIEPLRWLLLVASQHGKQGDILLPPPDMIEIALGLVRGLGGRGHTESKWIYSQTPWVPP
ncbi:hypothetical protein PTI98_011737 [Pleurotus ostreatus]|nr:hypothetical protein PTI98_011737 [Pleurotus ostreatus]